MTVMEFWYGGLLGPPRIITVPGFRVSVDIKMKGDRHDTLFARRNVMMPVSRVSWLRKPSDTKIGYDG